MRRKTLRERARAYADSFAIPEHRCFPENPDQRNLRSRICWLAGYRAGRRDRRTAVSIKENLK